MQRTELASLYKATPADGTKVTVCGWAKTVRDSKNIGFISLSDGSCYKPVQIVFQADKLANYAEIAKCGLYTSFEVTGSVVVTPGAKQPFEINADEITVLGPCGGDYPLQKKKMGMDYLRTMTHLRPRTNTFNAAFRVRGQAAFALHQFFHEHGFTYVHTPIFTGSDCEGAGEMFQVTTLDLNDIPRNDEGGVDYTKDFFKRPVNLTVSGQLEAEAMAMALGNVYTFGPTFRAEKSYDTRHAAEFWMIEPEMAFADLNTYLETAEAMTRYVIRYLLDNCPDELAFFNQFFDKGLIERLELVASSDFARVTYTDAIELLKKNNDNFQYKVEWGTDLQTEHERYLTEQIFKKPVFVTDYPKEIKAFYMRQNEDGKTVAAADMLVPGIGELIGGSQREERLDVLEARMKELGLNTADYDWYLDLRRYGSVKHAGYGLGFERLLMYVTGIPNIRDVIPFPPYLRWFLMQPIAAPLLQWFDANKRLLPFRQEPSAYHIWVSEIMLQQTRVAAAIPYYERFIAALPDPAALAACEPDALRKLWQGLGYYNRVNNMQKAARIVCEQYGGDLPADYDALRSLPGIGDYTAGAVASIAFGIPVPAVDGNVLRVFARLYNDDADVMAPATKKAFTVRVLDQMPKATPGPYNEALMELGALVCIPGTPHCGECPLADLCRGYAAGRADQLPVKPAPKTKGKVPVTVALIESEQGLLLQRRPARGLLAGLWQPAAWEKALTRDELTAALAGIGVQAVLDEPLPPAKHVFTHKIWELGGWKGTAPACALPEGYVWAAPEDLAEVYPVPNAFGAYVKAK